MPNEQLPFEEAFFVRRKVQRNNTLCCRGWQIKSQVLEMLSECLVLGWSARWSSAWMVNVNGKLITSDRVEMLSLSLLKQVMKWSRHEDATWLCCIGTVTWWSCANLKINRDELNKWWVTLLPFAHDKWLSGECQPARGGLASVSKLKLLFSKLSCV